MGVRRARSRIATPTILRVQPPSGDDYGPTYGAQWVRDGAGPDVVSDPGGGSIPFNNTNNIHTLIDSNPVGSTFVGAGSQTYTRTVTLSDRGRNPTIIFLPGAVLNGPGNAAGNIDAASFTNGTIRGGKWQNFTSGIVLNATAILEDAEITSIYNVGFGFLGSNSRATRVWSHHNGKYGLNGAGTITNVTAEYLRVNDNNTRKLDTGDDAGSSKFNAIDGMALRYCWFDHNYGNGPWWDTNVRNLMCEENVMENHYADTTTEVQSGLFYEDCEGGTVIQRNLLLDNGSTNGSLGLGNVQISSANGSKGGANDDVLITRNIIDCANGAIVQIGIHNGHVEDPCWGVHVVQNQIWLRGEGTIKCGGSDPNNNLVGRDNYFATNEYHLGSLNDIQRWHWNGTQGTNPKTWSQWQALDFDTDGTRVVI